MSCGYTQSNKFFGAESHETISDSIFNFYKKNKFGLLIGFGSTFWSIKDLDIYMIFNVCSIQCSVENMINREITPFLKNQWLRKIHPFTSLNTLEDNFTIENYPIKKTLSLEDIG